MSGQTKNVTLYHMNGCDHCHDMMPEWIKFKNLCKLHKDEIKDKINYELNVNDYEYYSNPKIVEQNNVSGFPTIKIGRSNDESEYKGERTAKSLLEAVLGPLNKVFIDRITSGPIPQEGGDYLIMLRYSNIDLPQVKYKNSYK